MEGSQRIKHIPSVSFQSSWHYPGHLNYVLFLYEKEKKTVWCWSAHSGALKLEEAADFVTQVIDTE